MSDVSRRAGRLLLPVLTLLPGCGGEGASPPPPPAELVLPGAETLISTESGDIAYPADLAVGPRGEVYVADRQAHRILVVEPAGGVRARIGREGEGPGEFSSPAALAVGDSALLVVDAENGRIQALSLDGDFLRQVRVGPEVLVATPHLLPDGGMVIGTLGRDSALAASYGPDGSRLRAYGEPVVEAPAFWDMRAIKAKIAEGGVPAEMRNDVLVAGGAGKGVWVALQTEAVVRRYDPEGRLLWSHAVEAPELAATRERFFRRNAEIEQPFAFAALRYFADVQAVGEELWLLLAGNEDAPGVLIVVSADGSGRRRIVLPDVRDATAFAFDPARRRLYLAVGSEARLVAVGVP